MEDKNMTHTHLPMTGVGAAHLRWRVAQFPKPLNPGWRWGWVFWEANHAAS